MTQEKLPHRKELCLQSEAFIFKDKRLFCLIGNSYQTKCSARMRTSRRRSICCAYRSGAKESQTTLYFFTKAKNFAITKQAIKPEGHTVGRIVSVGMASLIVQLSIVIIIAVNNNLLTKYGYHTYASTGEAFGAVIPLAVVGIVMKVFGIVVSIVIGISLGGQPIIGYNMGAGNTERVKKTIQLITKLVLLVGMVAFLIFELAPDAIIYSEAIILRNIWSMRDCVSGFSWEESS